MSVNASSPGMRPPPPQVAVIMPEFRDQFYTEVTRGIETRARQQGWTITATNTHDLVALQSAQIHAAARAGVVGILIAPAHGQLPAADLRAARVPVVIVGAPAPADEWSSVRSDDEQGGWIATRHLLDTGRRRLLFIGGPADAPWITGRLAGARRAVTEVDGARVQALITKGITVSDGIEVGERLMQLDRRPDAVFAANDLLAIGLLQGTGQGRGIAVPLELALCGFDDIAAASSQSVPLTSIHQPRAHIGAVAVELLLESIAGGTPRAVVVKSELVVRASTRAA